jgi:peptidoglycan/xylan/chitin deacetylase (PgdA/CDA1 family)
MIHLPRSARSTLAAMAGALALVALVGLVPARAAGTTVVSLTFDDGAASEYSARAILAAHGMRGTFYIPSGLIGSYSYYMSWQQVEALASDGNEIGGHTSYHVNLPQIEAAEAQRELCADRDVLLSHGFPVTTFAYPYASQNASVAQMVTDCGYNAVRPPGANGDPSLDTVKSAVTAAIAAGGGWVPIVFHDVCNGCTSLAISETDLSAYLDWLQQQSANGVVVKTIADVVGGAVKPAVQPPAAPAAPNGTNGVRNPSLEQDSNGDSVPDCFGQGGYGANTARWTRTTSAHSGSYAQRVDVTSYASGDNKMMVLQDLGSCSPSVVPGHRYVITSWYNSTAPVYFTAYGRDLATLFAYWTQSPTFPPSSTWTQARWVTPVIPSNLTGMSFGLTLASTGSLTIDDVGIDDAAATSAPDTSPPTVSLTAPATGATVSGVVQIAAQAADDVRLDHVDFLVDNQVVGSQVNAFPSFGWNSAAAPNGEHTFAARAVDTSGNATTSSPVTAFVSNQTVPNLLQNPSLETASGSNPTCWGLGGFGTNTYAWTRTSDAHTGSFGESVAISTYTSGDRKMVNLQDAGACAPAVTPGHTYTFTGWYKATTQPYVFAYYRNSAGSWVFWQQSGRPVASSWTKATYTTPSIPSGATRISIGMGIDAVGSITMDDFSLLDAAPVNTDTTPPTTSIACNNIQSEGGCATGYYPTAVAIQLTAVDNAGGSGVSSIRYTTDGTDPSLTNGNAYAGQFDTTTTVKYRAYDKAGNAEPVRTQQIRVDSIAPTATVTCNGGACAASAYQQPVAIALQGADTGGSGVAAIRYTTDGSDPTAAGATTYAAPFSLTATTTVRYAALDNAGNVGPVMTQLVQVDSTAPTVALTAPADGATVSGSGVTISATASDDGAVSQVQFLVGSTVVGTDTTAPYSIAWDSTSVPDGSVAITARATDSSGNVATSAAVTVSVRNDTTAPGVALTAPADGATVSGTNVPISATATDGSAVSQVEFLVGSTVVGTDTTAPYSIAWDSTSVPDGNVAITAKATDSSGNVGTSAAVTVSVRNDTTAPSVTVTAPVAGATVSGTSVPISATATDGSPIIQVQFLVGATIVGTDTTAPYSITWDSTTVPDGNVAITARATDSSGNVGTSSAVTASVRNTVGPTVANASLEADANGDATPDCFAGSGTGKSTVAYTRVTDAHTGTYAERMTVSSYKNGVRRFESVKDAGTCATAVASGRSYTLGLWYKSTAALPLTVSYRSSTGTWVSWVTSPSAPASPTWTQLTFRTPAIPAGATHLSFGVTVSSNATVTLDDWSIALAP